MKKLIKLFLIALIATTNSAIAMNNEQPNEIEKSTPTDLYKKCQSVLEDLKDLDLDYCTCKSVNNRITHAIITATEIAKKIQATNTQIVHVEFCESNCFQTYLVGYALADLGYKNLYFILVGLDNCLPEKAKTCKKALITKFEDLKLSIAVYDKGYKDYVDDVAHKKAPKGHSFSMVDPDKTREFTRKNLLLSPEDQGLALLNQIDDYNQIIFTSANQMSGQIKEWPKITINVSSTHGIKVILNNSLASNQEPIKEIAKNYKEFAESLKQLETTNSLNQNDKKLFVIKLLELAKDVCKKEQLLFGSIKRLGDSNQSMDRAGFIHVNNFLLLAREQFQQLIKQTKIDKTPIIVTLENDKGTDIFAENYTIEYE